MKRETNFFRNIEAEQSPIKHAAKRWYATQIKGRTEANLSSDLTKTKFNSLTLQEKEYLGINSPQDLNDPKLAARAVMFILGRNYSYLKNLQATYPYLGLTDEDVRNATILSYNQGMSKLRTLGFDNNGHAAPQELEALRQLADENLLIKDITATNYKYLPFGSWIYDIFGEGNTSYISSANKAIRENIRKKTINNNSK